MLKYLFTIFFNTALFADALLPVSGGEVFMGPVTNKDPQNEGQEKTLTLEPFSIGTYEVTNEEYANWLNQAKVHSSQKGVIRDQEGHILFKTKYANLYSQIVYDGKQFKPVEGKEKYPVILVTWYGAKSYCEDKGLRLPKEAEWEMAAAMKGDKKFIFGFSQDTIDPTWANYRATDKSIQYFQVLTKEVGFYNGVNELELPDGSKASTHDAKSPAGAYDMSGNVWEWVADDYNAAKKVVKGGCYDSTADGVRVAERLGLHPEHADPYTGFRVCK